MTPRIACAFVVVLAGCSASVSSGVHPVCTQQPEPPECSQTCNPAGDNTCAAGYYCGNAGTCTSDCNATISCPSNEMCTSDGHCEGSGGAGSDATCADVHFAPVPTIPSIELLIDRSGSMDMSDIPPTRYQALEAALTG